jgi:methyl-accepting chemotaxis protein
MFSFKNIRISFKVFIAPVLAIVFLVGLAGVSFVSLERQTAALDGIYNVRFKKNVLAQRTVDLVAAAHVDLYRMLNWLAMSDDRERVSILIEGINTNVANAGSTLGELKEAFAVVDGEQDVITKAREATDAYATSMNDVVQMVQVDLTTGLLLMTMVEETFTSLKERLKELNDFENRLSQRTFDDAVADADRTRQTFMIVVGVAVVLSILATMLVSRQITGPISRMTSVMDRLADGDMEVTVPDVGRRDEVGRMASAVQVFKDNAVEMEARRRENAELETRAAEERRRAINELADNFDATTRELVPKVTAISSSVQDGARVMLKAVEETTEETASAGVTAEITSSNVQAVATAAEQLADSIRRVDHQVSESVSIVATARDAAAGSSQTIGGLASATEKIGSVIELIDGIAGQTNMLALNATIEAARAGSAGKGFAIVASEVKNLANQTGQATQEITMHVSSIQEDTKRAVKEIASIAEIVAKINDISGDIAEAMRQQGGATEEIARNIQEAAGGTADVSRKLADLNETAASTRAAANDVQGSVNSFADLSSELNQSLNQFQEHLRTS